MREPLAHQVEVAHDERAAAVSRQLAVVARQIGHLTARALAVAERKQQQRQKHAKHLVLSFEKYE